MTLTERLHNPDRRIERIDAFYRDQAKLRIDRREVEPIVEPIIEPAVLHRDGTGGRIPEWRRRAMDQGIARDETGRT